MNSSDEGGLRLSISRGQNKTVVIDFGKQVTWIGLDKDQAIAFAHSVIEHAMGMKCKVHIAPLEMEGDVVTDSQ